MCVGVVFLNFQTHIFFWRHTESVDLVPENVLSGSSFNTGYYYIQVPDGQQAMTLFVCRLPFVPPMIISYTLKISKESCDFDVSYTVSYTESIQTLVINQTSPVPLTPGRWVVTMQGGAILFGFTYNWQLGFCFGEGCTVSFPVTNTTTATSTTLMSTATVSTATAATAASTGIATATASTTTTTQTSHSSRLTPITLSWLRNIF